MTNFHSLTIATMSTMVGLIASQPASAMPAAVPLKVEAGSSILHQIAARFPRRSARYRACRSQFRSCLQPTESIYKRCISAHLQSGGSRSTSAAQLRIKAPCRTEALKFRTRMSYCRARHSACA